MAKPNVHRLTLLADLRLAAGLTLADMARRCGLRGNQSHQTAGAWERGAMIPSEARRRPHFLGYLWDDLGLRHDPARFEAVWAMLVDEWGWEPLGDREWARLTTVARPQPSPPQPVSSPAPRAPFQAPALIPHFVGRTAPLTALTDLLTAPTARRPVALVGMGGVGKSTLAIHAAHALRGAFVDGVLWAQTAISAPLDILQSWARALGYDYRDLRDAESCAAALRSALTDRALLFVLDDVTSVQRVRPLLVGGAASAVLLTTRSEDDATALGSHILPLAELEATATQELLVQLLGAERVAAEAAAAAAIGELLHHLPLAVEIVGQLLAARSRRTLAQMAALLQDVQYRLDLQISDRDVRTSFLVSWAALDGAHRRLFTQLAVFAGRSFTVSALAALLGEDAATVLDRLELLVARSLVKAVEAARYRQHPLLADFAREQLGDAPAVWTRFAESQLAFAREHQTDYAALEPEWDNVMAGMAAAQRLERWATVVDYAEVLTEPWFTRARFMEARQGFRWAVTGATVLNQLTSKFPFLDCWAQAALELGDYQEAADLLRQCATDARASQNLTLLAKIEYLQARVARQFAEYEKAEQHLLQSYQLRRDLNDELGIAEVIYGQAHLAYQRGDYTLAGPLREQALAVQRAKGEKLGMLRTLRLLSLLAVKQEAYDCAEAHGQEALALAKELNNQGEYGSALYSLAIVAKRQERLADAEQLAQQSAQLFETMGDRRSLALALHELSIVQERLENYQDAIALEERSLQLLQELADEFVSIYALLHLGDLYMRLGEPQHAARYWLAAAALPLMPTHPLQAKLASRLQML
jgi:predicted ATPase